MLLVTSLCLSTHVVIKKKNFMCNQLLSGTPIPCLIGTLVHVHVYIHVYLLYSAKFSRFLRIDLQPRKVAVRDSYSLYTGIDMYIISIYCIAPNFEAQTFRSF